MKQRRRRKCLHCCSELACRRAGKAASQRRWLNKAANRDYFHGLENVERVRAWRARNPGYWRAARLSANSQQCCVKIGYRTDAAAARRFSDTEGGSTGRWPDWLLTGHLVKWRHAIFSVEDARQ